VAEFRFAPEDSGQPTRPREPTEEEWSGHVDDLETLLGSLVRAGWELPESYDSDFDCEHGAFLFGELHRTGMVIGIQYEPSAGKLQLLPFEGDDPLRLSMLDEPVEIRAGHDLLQGADVAADRAGELGLLDATHLMAAPDSDITTAELISHWYQEELFEPAARYRGLTLAELAGQLAADEEFSLRMRFITGMAGSRVLPDLVPGAVALGIAAWCWRNDTEVETWHLPTDVLMAKVNISVTKTVRPHIDPVDGVDWEGVEEALTDSRWSLPDARVISALFGEGWPEVQQTVRRQVRMWRRFDEDLIGAEAMLRLLTVAGSTSYTRHWWGQGRWAAICRTIISDATRAAIPLPAPYDTKGAEALLRDLTDPDVLSDDALAWMIDIPGAGYNGPRGLRSHESTRPITHEFTLYHFGDVE
jgi:hypothetical protein